MRSVPEDRGYGWREDAQREKTGVTPVPRAQARTQGSLSTSCPAGSHLVAWESHEDSVRAPRSCHPSEAAAGEFLLSLVRAGELGSALACLACFCPASQRDSPSLTPKGAHGNPRGKALRAPRGFHSGLLRIFAFGSEVRVIQRCMPLALQKSGRADGRGGESSEEEMKICHFRDLFRLFTYQECRGWFQNVTE